MCISNLTVPARSQVEYLLTGTLTSSQAHSTQRTSLTLTSSQVHTILALGLTQSVLSFNFATRLHIWSKAGPCSDGRDEGSGVRAAINHWGLDLTSCSSLELVSMDSLNKHLSARTSSALVYDTVHAV